MESNSERSHHLYIPALHVTTLAELQQLYVESNSERSHHLYIPALHVTTLVGTWAGHTYHETRHDVDMYSVNICNTMYISSPHALVLCQWEIWTEGMGLAIATCRF